MKSVSAYSIGLICMVAGQMLGQSSGVSPARRPSMFGPDFSRKVDGLFAPFVEGARPGAVVLVSRAGKTVHLKAYGMANVSQHIPLATDSVFDLGSISKPITALAVMLL